MCVCVGDLDQLSLEVGGVDDKHLRLGCSGVEQRCDGRHVGVVRL